MDSSLNSPHVRTFLNGASYSELRASRSGSCSSKLSLLATPLFVLLVLSGAVPAAAVVSLLQRDAATISHRTLALQEDQGVMGDGPEDLEIAELLRFVTPYGAELEAIVDITGYAPLLDALLTGSGKIDFYAAIDTWVSNDTRRRIVYVNNVTGTCSAFNTSDGNAWNVSVDLVVWPKSAMSGISPRATVLLAESFPKPLLPIGAITGLDGTLSGSELNLTEVADLKASTIFPCPYGLDRFKSGAMNGMIAQFAERQIVANKQQDKAFLDNLTAMMEENFLQGKITSDLVAGSVKQVLVNPDALLEIILNEPVQLVKDMPVFFADGATATDAQYSPTLWLNMSYPFKPVGFVQHIVNNSHFFASVTLPCFQALNSSTFPGVQIPRSWDVIPNAKRKLHALQQLGVDSGLELLQNGELPKSKLRILDFNEMALQEHFPMAQVELGSGSNIPQSFATKGLPVCVVHEEESGHVFTRPFTSKLSPGERAILHLTVTGHGWAATSEQCGEYCHAVYNLHLNGRSFANVTQWRDDCYLNPTGPSQHGTWFESRNGWCPGTVEPGIFIDVSEHLNHKAEVNVFKLELAVWLNASHRYDRYVDYNGFIQGDTAMLAVTTHVLIYGKDAVDAALAAPRASSKAEAAIRQGCSDPKALRPPAVVRNFPDGFVSSERARKKQQSMTYPPQPVVPPQQVPFDFEARSPWYFYNVSREMLPGLPAGATYFTVFPGTLVQANSRTIYRNLLRGRLGQELSERQSSLQKHSEEQLRSYLEVDHWDRVGSVGVMLPKTPLPNVEVNSKEPPPAKQFKFWQVSR